MPDPCSDRNMETVYSDNKDTEKIQNTKGEKLCLLYTAENR